MFAGTGAIIINGVSGGAVTSVGIGLTFGLIVLAMIYAIGDVSGAHLNPAVTLGFFAARRLEARIILPYILSQVSGALVAPITGALLAVAGCRCVLLFRRPLMAISIKYETQSSIHLCS